MKFLTLVLVSVFLSPSLVLAQTQRSDQVAVPTPPIPTVSPDVMYRLGEQSGQLSTISGRLDKIEVRLEGFHEDIVQIKTVETMLAAVVLIFVGPILVSWVQRRLKKNGSAN